MFRTNSALLTYTLSFDILTDLLVPISLAFNKPSYKSLNTI